LSAARAADPTITTRFTFICAFALNAIKSAGLFSGLRRRAAGTSPDERPRGEDHARTPSGNQQGSDSPCASFAREGGASPDDETHDEGTNEDVPCKSGDLHTLSRFSRG